MSRSVSRVDYGLVIFIYWRFQEIIIKNKWAFNLLNDFGAQFQIHAIFQKTNIKIILFPHFIVINRFIIINTYRTRFQAIKYSDCDLIHFYSGNIMDMFHLIPPIVTVNYIGLTIALHISCFGYSPLSNLLNFHPLLPRGFQKVYSSLHIFPNLTRSLPLTIS